MATKQSSKKKKGKHQQPARSQDTITYGPPPPTTTFPVVPANVPPAAMYPAPAPGPPGMIPVGQFPPGPALVPGTMPMAMAGRPLPNQPNQPQPQQQQQKQLEFSQAMADFQTMFPKMDRVVIETVLRANNGKVDETIDQLLKLNEDIPDAPPPVQHHVPPSSSHPIPPSQLPPEFMSPSFPAEPPPYTPPEPDSPFSRYSNAPTTNTSTPSPLQHRTSAPAGGQRVLPTPSTPDNPPELLSPHRPQSWTQESRAHQGNSTSRQWNPAVRGDLPSDFLRMSLSESPSNPSTPAVSVSPSGHQGQPKMTRGIQERLDKNRRQSMDRNTQRDAQFAQVLEDERIALLLQNEEFLRQLQHNPEFLSALERDYEESLRDGSANRNNSPDSIPSGQTVVKPIPAPRKSQPPPIPELPPPDLYEQPNPNVMGRPLPATPTSTASPNHYAPGRPARPLSLRKDSSSSSLGSSGLPSPGLPNGSSSSRPPQGSRAEGGVSIDDIEFRNKLNHMGKSSKTTLSVLAGKFMKKSKKSKKYDLNSEGGTDPLLGEDRVYEELAEPKPVGTNPAGGNIYHETKKSSKKKLSLKSRHRDASLLYYEDTDPNYFSR